MQRTNKKRRKKRRTRRWKMEVSGAKIVPIKMMKMTITMRKRRREIPCQSKFRRRKRAMIVFILL